MKRSKTKQSNNGTDESLIKVQHRLKAVKNPEAAKIDDYSNRLDDLYLDFLAHETKGVASQIERNVARFMRPLFEQAANKLNIVIGNTRETFRLYSEIYLFISTFVKTHGHKSKKAPPLDEIKNQVKEFLFWRDLEPKLIHYWSLEFADKPFLMPDDRQEFYQRYGLNRQNYSIKDRLREVEYSAKGLLGVDATCTVGKRIIFSVEHPDVFHADLAIIPIISEMKEKGIDVELVRGAYKYESGKYKGKVIEEISLLCHFSTEEQKTLILDWLEPFGQESYLYLAEDGLTTSIKISNGERTEYGYWTKVQSIPKESLQEGQGFSILNGECFQAIQKSASNLRAA
ncbi:MAG: hypothetical protein JNM39_17240 [Bdellovibrionaceae bacterium]|nr:hypothetical protein [Pseudobdellovibrionaceae bacterium]